MVFIWLVVGIILASLAYFIPGKGTDLWPSINPAGIVIAVYLVALTAYMARKPFQLKIRIITWAIFLTCGVSLFIGWRTWDEESHWQRSTLLNILGVIFRGVNEVYTHDTLTVVLKTYYSPSNKPHQSLGQIFLSRHPECRDGRPIPASQHTDSRPEYDSLYMYPVTVSDSEIVLAVSHKYAKGRDPAFKNINGKTGMVQIRQTLTPKGIRYESEN